MKGGTMQTMARASAAALAILTAGSVLGACSSGPSPKASSTTTTSAPATTTTTGAPPTSTTVVTTTCQPSQLHVVRSGFEGAAGTIELTFSLTNASTVPCTMHGYPGMLLLDSSGSALPTVVDRGGGLAFENVAVTDVSLAPGQAAFFNVGYNDVTTGTTTCSTASQAEITPPNDTSHAVVSMSPTIDACDGGTLHVSPVFASTDSAATQTTAP
jgi:hypothetical protein